MSILKIVAIVGAVLGILFCIMETRKTGKKYLGIFVALIFVSAALFAIAGQAEDKFTALAAEKSMQVQSDAQALAALDTIQPAQDGAIAAEEDDNEFNMLDDSDEVGAVDAQVPEQPELAEGAQVPESETAAPEGAPDVQPAPEADNVPAPEAAVADVAAPAEHARGAARERRHGDAARNKANVEDSADTAVAAVPAAVDNAPAPVANDAQDTDSATSAEGGKLVADAGPNIESAKLNEAIQFTAKQSRIPKGVGIRSFSWDFGDGHKADGREVKHTYTNMGKYTVTLTVTDMSGQSSVATKAVDVNRPENKIKLAFKALEDLQQVTQAPAAFVSMFEKTYAGTKINIDATGYILAEAGGKCELVVSIDGPNCVVSKNKILENGGEGDVNVKASCKGDPGEYTWMVTRKVHKGICSFNSIKVDVSEN